MKLLVINGPNLNLLGLREPEIYGTRDYAALCGMIRERCEQFGFACEIRQSNHEGDLVDFIQEAFGTADAIVINPAAYTHTSIAILDALKAVGLPAVEVHLSDVDRREAFRRVSYAGMACEARFSGAGFDSYLQAIDYLAERLHVSGMNGSN